MGEHPITLPHRPREHTLTKWVVGAFSAGVLSVLAFLAVMDRARIEDTGERALAKATGHDTELAVLRNDLEDMNEKLDEILAIVRAE